MFFLNEHLIAAFLSIISFLIAFFASLFFKVGIYSALLRSTVIAFIFMFAGLVFGKVMKNIIVEAFLQEEEKTEKEQAENEKNKEADEIPE
jgi:hypothetical protein